RQWTRSSASTVSSSRATHSTARESSQRSPSGPTVWTPPPAASSPGSGSTSPRSASRYHSPMTGLDQFQGVNAAYVADLLDRLEAETHDLTDDELARLPASVVGGPVGARAANAAEAIGRLRAIYCDTTGYELGHVQVPAERDWLFEAAEDERFRPPHDPIDEPR